MELIQKFGIRLQILDCKNYDKELVEKGKRKNKKELAGQFGLDPDKPLISFIGRLVGEKAADLLPDAISQSIYQHHGNANFLIGFR